MVFNPFRLDLRDRRAFEHASYAQTWSPVAELPDGHLTNHAFGFAVDGTGYPIAGQTPDGFTNAAYSYDPVTDTWSSLPISRRASRLHHR